MDNTNPNQTGETFNMNGNPPLTENKIPNQPLNTGNGNPNISINPTAPATAPTAAPAPSVPNQPHEIPLDNLQATLSAPSIPSPSAPEAPVKNMEQPSDIENLDKALESNPEKVLEEPAIASGQNFLEKYKLYILAAGGLVIVALIAYLVISFWPSGAEETAENITPPQIENPFEESTAETVPAAGENSEDLERLEEIVNKLEEQTGNNDQNPPTLETTEEEQTPKKISR